MKLKIKQVIDSDDLILFAYLPTDEWYDREEVFNGRTYECLDDVLVDYPGLCGTIDGVQRFLLQIEIGTGKVLNWPLGATLDLHDWKIVDEGTYQIKDRQGNLIVGYSGYVPSCFAIDDNGFGDYLEFEIDKNGNIPDWNFGQECLDEFFENAD